jgi:hypothetical protein
MLPAPSMVVLELNPVDKKIQHDQQTFELAT